MAKHVEIQMNQNASCHHIHPGAWFALGNNKIALAGFYDMDHSPLTYDECLVAAIKRAQELGYNSFSITVHPHPDFEEQKDEEHTDTYHDSQHRVLTSRITDLEKMVHALQDRVKWESKKASDLYTCIGELQDADRHLDKTIDAVSQRVDDLAIYRRNHLEYILPDLEARIRDLERNR